MSDHSPDIEELRTFCTAAELGSIGRAAIRLNVSQPALSAVREARARCAPVMLSRQVLSGHDFHEVDIDGLAFPREFVIVLPAVGEPRKQVQALIDELRHHASIWCRTHRLGGPALVEA